VDALFCQAYVPFLGQLLEVLSMTVDPPQLERAVRAAGRRMAPPGRSTTLGGRVEAAAAALDDMGGVTEVKARRNGQVTYEIHGSSCPFDSIVRSHPVACLAIESLVAEMTGAKSRQSCRRVADKARCVIEVSAR
jgi:predicted ArsR family transcriptional regulator